MDWPKAKNIIIVMLVALNIFLTAFLLFLNQGSTISTQTVKNTEKILNSKGITLKGNIPRSNRNPGHLRYDQESRFGKVKIVEQLLGDTTIFLDQIENNKEIIRGTRSVIFLSDNSFIFTDQMPSTEVDILSLKEVRKEIIKKLDFLGINISKFDTDLYQRSGENAVEVVLREKYNGILIFDNMIEATVSRKGSTQIKFCYTKVKEIEKVNSSIINGSQILLKNYTEKSNISINTIDLGFMEYNIEQDTRELFKRPVWRIRTDSGEEHFYNATDGSKII